jgi:cation transport regulator
MPYVTNAELPASIRWHLPAHAQDIFRAAFNNAYRLYQGDPWREEIAHRVAWAAVKRSYRKQGAEWVPKGKHESGC